MRSSLVEHRSLRCRAERQPGLLPREIRRFGGDRGWRVLEGDVSAGMPASASAARASSVFAGAASITVTGNPASPRYRATTQPSPPLFPGPVNTATPAGSARRKRRMISSAAARPALSISSTRRGSRWKSSRARRPLFHWQWRHGGHGSIAETPTALYAQFQG